MIRHLFSICTRPSKEQMRVMIANAAEADLRAQRVHWVENACKAKPRIGDGMGRKGMGDGNGAWDDTGQSLSDSGDYNREQF